MTVSSVVQLSNERRQFQHVFPTIIEYEAVYDPPAVNSNSYDSETITVTGAKFGDFVLVNIDVDLQSLTMTGYVSAADTVKVTLANNTAGAVNIGSCNLHILVLRPNHLHAT